jgi:hypothetical protein
VLLVLLLALAGPPSGSVELTGEQYRGLTAKPIEVQPAPWAERRALVLTPAADGLQIRGTWQIRAFGTGWFSGQLFGPTPGLRIVDARWNGQPAAVKVGDDGGTIAGRVQGSAELVVEAFVPGDPARAAIALQLLPAVRGTIEARAPEGLVPAVKLGGAPSLQVRGVHRGAAQDVELAFETPPQPAEGRPPVVVARVGVGLTVGDAELRGRARAIWEVRQGEIAAVEMLASGTGADLEVTGPNVRAWAREGERVRVELQAPVRDRVELELRWTAPIGRAAESRASVPRIAPEGVFRSETALQLARDGEVEAIPEVPGASLVASAALPGWAQGLVEGTATASLVGGTGGELSLLRFVPLEGPPVVVDVASYTVATSREGRALIRAHYEVRNERAASLKLRPPPGFKVIGIRVGGKTAAPGRTKDGAWIVPLLRSVETVRGLLSFPIEVILLGESTEWRRREARSLELPRVDASVAVSRVTLHLPPGYRSRKKAGEGDVVAAFTRGEGITYGLGTGEVGAAQADATFQDAVQAWMSNDFGAAQQKLDELRSIGAKNENIDRLQSNLDVVSGKANAAQDQSLQRRIREQAKARAYADVQAQAELTKKAEEEKARGDYEAAASSYGEALKVGDKLAALEQAESFDQRSTNAAIQQEILEVEVVSKKKRKERRGPRKGKAASDSAGFGGGGGGGEAPRVSANVGGTVYDFEDDGISGELVAPSGGATGGDGIADEAERKPTDAPTTNTTRDFTAVVDLVPGADGKMTETVATGSTTTPVQNLPVAGPTPVLVPEGTAHGGQFAPPAEPEPLEMPAFEMKAEPMPAPPAPAPAPEPVVTADLAQEVTVARRGRLFRAPGVASRRASRRAEKAASPPADDLDASGAKDMSQNGMPTPVVHASALSVVVPAVGEAVRYQRLLLPPDAAYSIEIAAKEPLIAKE